MFKIAYHHCYHHLLPDGHRFPMEKYDLIPQQLQIQGVISEHQLFEPSLCTDDILALTHHINYIENLTKGTIEPGMMRRIGFPYSKELITRERIITRGTIECALFALKFGASMNIAGGTHHAFNDRGEGFCIFNDIAVAANYLLYHNLVKKIAIIDLDVHQGNGSASLFKNTPNVFTFSMHGRNNYPFLKEKSDLDIALEDGIDDTGYLQLLSTFLPKLIEDHKPEIIFYQCGVDILESDKFGKLKISMDGCMKRDAMVFATARNCNLPIVAVLGGGYSPNISQIVDAHCQTFIACKKFYFD